MKKINLIGPVDKRLVAYPLLKAMIMLGKTLVITDDANFRRFSDKYELNFNYAQSDFIILHNISDFKEDMLDQPITVYDFILYITTNELVESDLVVYCHGLNKSIVTEEVKEKLEDIEHKEIYITTTPIKQKGIIQITVGKNMSYVWGCEEYRLFMPCSDTSITKVVAHVFTDILDNKELIKVMGRKEGAKK